MSYMSESDDYYQDKSFALEQELARLTAELASAKEELSLVKCGEPNHPDRAYAMKSWLKTFGFRVFCELKHGDVGIVLSLLQEGDISRGKAAEAIVELLAGNKPPLPALNGNTFGEDDFPSETVAKLRAELAAANERAETLQRDRAEMSIQLRAAVERVAELEIQMKALYAQVTTAEHQRDEMAAAAQKAGDALDLLYGRYGSGDVCFVGGDITGSPMGNAVQLSGPEETLILEAMEAVGIETILRRQSGKRLNPSAILAARDKAQRRAGAVAGLKEAHKREYVRWADVVELISAIERGEVAA